MNESSDTWYFVRTKFLNMLKIKEILCATYSQIDVKCPFRALIGTNLGDFLSHFSNFVCSENLQSLLQSKFFFVFRNFY